MIYILAGLCWVVSGVLAYGLTVNHFQRRYASIASETAWGDRILAAFCALVGPVGLLAFLMNRAIGRDETTPPLGWML